MSDFDKEAEREKLREKYERDKADREATQRMSDLLLKGATMTNTHCDACGDPLFRMNGTTFCPTCHGSPEAVEGTLGEAEREGDERSPDVDADEDGDGAVDSRADASPTADATPRVDDEEAGVDTEPEPAERAIPSADEAPDARARSQSPEQGGDPAATEREDPSPSRPSTGADSGNAADDLERALERFAREAAEADDPRYAKSCLEAAREAAETLSVLRR